jgi:hypothetical protein
MTQFILKINGGNKVGEIVFSKTDQCKYVTFSLKESSLNHTSDIVHHKTVI